MPTRSDPGQTYRDAGRCWYVQGQYVQDNLSYAEHPIYFDSLAEAQAEVRRQRRWPAGSTERYADICEQEYSFGADGVRRMGASHVLAQVADNLCGVYGLVKAAEYAAYGPDAEWMALTVPERFARLKKQINETFDGRHDVPPITTADNAQQIPEERELSPEQQQALIAERDRQLEQLKGEK